MAITIKSAAEIEGMRVAGRLAAEVLDLLTPHVVPGVTTLALDRIALNHIETVQHAVSATVGYAPPGYPPFPASICTSINHQVCHGIPNEKPLKNGDIVNIDVTVIKDGWHGDTSRMFIVGQGSIAARRLVQKTYEAMWTGIEKVGPGVRLGDIGHAIQVFAEGEGFSVVREFCGHGIGRRFHEEPQVLHYGRAGTLDELQPGMTFTIEPMINAGKREVREAGNDGWTIVTKDRSLSAQWEHTVLVTPVGYEVLTLSACSPPPPAFVKGFAAAPQSSKVAGRRLRAPRLRVRKGSSPPMDSSPARFETSRVGTLRTAFREEKQALLDVFDAARPTARAAVRLLHDLARLVDRTLVGLWEDVGSPADAALVAVGGYGRGELFPHSDIDVLVLLPAGETESASTRVAVTQFIADCWDAGLEIGSSVRTVADCVALGAGDVTVQTALLESRFLAGERGLFRAFQRARDAALDPPAFFRAKTLELQQRHQKFENTPYSLEPNVKESPGGLRDLQTVIWVARAAGLGRTWPNLAVHGLITRFEVKQLRRNEGTLKLIRARLHTIAGRREDRLVFDLQTAVAESFGYKAAHGQRASERLMRRYYWAAKAVTQLNLILLLGIEERVMGMVDAPMRPLGAEFLERGGMLEVASDDLYTKDPHAILRTFHVYQQSVGVKGLSARTLRALYNARHVMDAAFRNDAVNHATFMKILKAESGQTHAFRLMNDTSVLGRYLWVFRRIVGQMQHDLFHVYTVDQHILMVLRNVRRFLIPEHAHEYPFCSQLASTFDRPWVLYVAALFHDVAKGRGGDHSVLGTLEVKRFCRNHGIGRDDHSLIEFLVLHHLTMSRVAQKEDLSDPEVISAFAAQVGSERRLVALYLLTVADIRGTSPRVWNAWKGKLLEDLFRSTLRALGGSRPNLDAEIEATKLEARLLLSLASLPGTVEVPLWRTLELSYFARHDASEIAWHTRSLVDKVDAPEPVVKARVSPHGVGLQVLVYAGDRQDLFARICGYFDSADWNILDAKVHTTATGYGLDTFLVESPHADGQQHRDLIHFVERQLAIALKEAGPLPEPRRGRLSRRVRSFPITPRITLRPDEKAQRWLLGVSASDRSGLLYAISRVLARHDINLQLAKITTLGERVEDTFLIDGPALQQNKLQLQIETEMLDAIA